MERVKGWDMILSDRANNFLKERFNIDDIEPLSDFEYAKLYEEVYCMELKAFEEVIDTGNTISEEGDIASSCVTYMGFQYQEGGWRWKRNRRFISENNSSPDHKIE